MSNKLWRTLLKYAKDDDPIPCEGCQFRSLCSEKTLSCKRYYLWTCSGKDISRIRRVPLESPSKKYDKLLFPGDYNGMLEQLDEEELASHIVLPEPGQADPMTGAPRHSYINHRTGIRTE